MVSKRKQIHEGSKQDIVEDKRGAARLKLSFKQYEGTAQDRAEDTAGQVKLERKLGLKK